MPGEMIAPDVMIGASDEMPRTRHGVEDILMDWARCIEKRDRETGPEPGHDWIVQPDGLVAPSPFFRTLVMRGLERGSATESQNRVQGLAEPYSPMIFTSTRLRRMPSNSP